MIECTRCDGFIPADLGACPNCGADTADASGSRAARVVGCAAMMMTLMACYGGGDRFRGCQEIPLGANGSAEGTTASCELSQNGIERATCGPASTPAGLVIYTPTAADKGKPGKLTVSWTVVSAIVPDPGIGLYVFDEESHKQLACVAPNAGSSLTIDVTAAKTLALVVIGAQSGTFSKFRVTTLFQPAPAPN